MPPPWTLSSYQLLSKLLLYIATAVLGCFVSIPVAVTSKNFAGHCMLYSQYKDNRAIPGSKSHCEFIVYLHVVMNVICGALMAGLHALGYLRNKQKQSLQLHFLANPVFNLVMLAINAGTTFFVLIAACELSVGFTTMCSNLKAPFTDISCQEFQTILSWSSPDWYAASFYTCFTIATVCVWMSLAAWLAQTGLSIFQILRTRKEDVTTISYIDE